VTRLTVDFSQTESYEPLPPGEYPVVIDAIELKQSESSEHPYLNFTLKVSEGEFANRNLWFIGSLSPKALFRLQAVFSSFGLTETNVELNIDDASGVLLEPQLVGLPAMARCRNEMYAGSLRTRVEELVGVGMNTAPAVASSTNASPSPKRQSPFAPRTGDKRIIT
jgi:hypothetical protein